MGRGNACDGGSSDVMVKKGNVSERVKFHVCEQYLLMLLANSSSV